MKSIDGRAQGTRSGHQRIRVLEFHPRLPPQSDALRAEDGSRSGPFGRSCVLVVVSKCAPPINDLFRF